MKNEQGKMDLNPSSNLVEVVDFSFHWLGLKKADFNNVLNYIAKMEIQFDKAEKVIAMEDTKLIKGNPSDFDDLKWALYRDLAFLGLVTDTEWANYLELEDKLESPDQFHEMDYLTLCKLMAIATSGSHFSDGYFDRMIRNKTILRLLKALSIAIEIRDKI